jgi:nudix-type nucleoside diphosphatase (YffH/AdpP family)
MPSRVQIHQKRTVFQQAIFRIEEAQLQHERYSGGMSEEMTRLMLDRGDAVAVVVHNIADDTLAFTEQFRYPAYAAEEQGGWLLELPAGIVASDEDPAAAARRELSEETGFEVTGLHFISQFFLSPGGSSERIYLYYARVHSTDRTGTGGGVPWEHEDIDTVFVPLDDVEAMVADGRIQDAKTLIGCLWALRNRDQLAGLL